MTGFPKGAWRLFFSNTQNRQPFLSNPRCESGEVAIAADKAKPVKFPGVEQVHCIDDERDVRRVLSWRVGELLNGFDGVFLEDLVPL